MAPFSSSPSPTLVLPTSRHIKICASMTSGKQNAEIYIPYRFFFPCWLLVPPGIQEGENMRTNKLLTVIQLPMIDPFTVLFCVIPAQLGTTALGPHSWRSRRALVGDLPRNPCICSIHKDVQAPQLTLIGCQHPRSGRRGSGFAASGT